MSAHEILMPMNGIQLDGEGENVKYQQLKKERLGSLGWNIRLLSIVGNAYNLPTISKF